MALYKEKLKKGFALPECEKHFHDFDETWVILKGNGNGYWLDHEGNREDFDLEEGDVWMIPAGYEHGSEGPNSEDFTISTFIGTQAPGSQPHKHYYVEEEGYIPTLQLVKHPSVRYPVNSSIPETMKGLIYIEKGKAAIQEEPTPNCEAGHLLCKTLFSGITNGTERNVLTGGSYAKSWPSRSGYQVVGQVLEVGIGVEGFKAGDTIYSGEHSGHMEYFKVPVIPGEDNKMKLVIKLPETIEKKEAALFGMAAVALHDVRRAGTKLGDKVLVVGAGPVGQFTAQAAQATGAIVSICDINVKRLNKAGELGIGHKFKSETDEDWTKISDHGPFDIVFEDSGADIFDKVLGFDKERGVLKNQGKLIVIAGRKDVGYNFNAGQFSELEIIHASHFEFDDLEQLLRLVDAGVIKIGPVIQDVVPIQDAVQIYDRLRDAPVDLFGTVFTWE